MGMPKSNRFWAKLAPAASKDPRRNWRYSRARWLGFDIGQPGRVPRYTTKRHFGKPKAQRSWITLGPELSRISADLMEGVAPALMEAFDDEMGPWAEEILREWPEYSGASRASLQLNYIVKGSTITAQIRMTAPYALYVYGGAAHRLIFGRAPEVARRIRDRAAHELAKV